MTYVYLEGQEVGRLVPNGVVIATCMQPSVAAALAEAAAVPAGRPWSSAAVDCLPMFVQCAGAAWCMPHGPLQLTTDCWVPSLQAWNKHHTKVLDNQVVSQATYSKLPAEDIKVGWVPRVLETSSILPTADHRHSFQAGRR